MPPQWKVFFLPFLLETTAFPSFLGEYFRTDEFADQSQENLSSSSLRRKLFLEENGNISECLTPSLHNPCSSQPLGVLCSIDISPVRCRTPLETSSSVSSQMGDGWEVTLLAQTLYSSLYQFYFLTNSRQSYFCSKLYRRLGIRPMFFNYVFRTIYMSNNFERMQLIFNSKKDVMLCCYSLLKGLCFNFLLLWKLRRIWYINY